MPGSRTMLNRAQASQARLAAHPKTSKFANFYSTLRARATASSGDSAAICRNAATCRSCTLFTESGTHLAGCNLLMPERVIKAADCERRGGA